MNVGKPSKEIPTSSGLHSSTAAQHNRPKDNANKCTDKNRFGKTTHAKRDLHELSPLNYGQVILNEDLFVRPVYCRIF